MRQMATSVTVTIGDTAIATMAKIEKNLAPLHGRDRTVWKVRVASGVDLSLVGPSNLCLMFFPCC